MTEWLLAGAGGFVGAVSRFLLGGFVQRSVPTGFPLGTLAVNVVGCAAIGVVLGLADARGGLGDGLRAFLVVGVLGGFTTFSAFGADTVSLMRAGTPGMAALNVLLQLVLGVGAAAAGFSVASR